MRLCKEGETVKTIKWFVQEYRHEDQEGRYYLVPISKIYMSGVRCGLSLGVIPLVLYWILR